MKLQELTKQFGKKNIPQIHPGDTIRVSFKITEGKKTRIQAFEGICIALKNGQSLNGSFTVRKISSGIGVERVFPLHSPLVTKIEKIKSRQVRQSKLYFVRGLVGKKAKKAREEKDYKMWEEAVAEEEIEKIEEEKKIEAEKKAEEKAKEKEQLEKQFEQAVSQHTQEEKTSK
ncbi:MAG: 50S ribosomal protein L19 [Patescibacteria group bacterium]|nr:50S ribosomal protein L19 [Patescibacteria group bacterium]